jgi:Poly(A) polymerase predicted RNA binding domain
MEVNSAYNTGVPQKRRIQDEMVRAAYLMQNGDSQWRALFQPSDFFIRHSNFLQVTIRAGNAEDFMKWFRLCESRLRILIGSLESSQISSWPFAHFMKRGYTASGVIASGNQSTGKRCVQETLFFIALRFTLGVGSTNLKQCTSEFLYNHINSWEERKPGMDVLLAHVIQRDLPFDLINENLMNENLKDHLSDSRTDARLEQESEIAHGDGVVCVPTAPEAAVNEMEGDDSSKGSSRRPDTPIEAGMAESKEECTRLTPKLARSTISEIDLKMMSPTKRPRNNPVVDSQTRTKSIDKTTTRPTEGAPVPSITFHS